MPVNNDTNLEKDTKININMRIKESLRDKLRERMASDEKTPDEFFSDMFYAYLKDAAEQRGEADYSNDILELNSVVKRTVTIFQNMIEKTYMQNTITKEGFAKEISDVKESLTNEYTKKIAALEKECEKAKREYNMIAEQAEGLLKDTRELKENLSLLKNTNDKNEELIATYREQIDSLKSRNSFLEEKVNSSVDNSLLDKAEIEKEKALIEKDKHYQNIINSMQIKYNELQDRYTKSIENTYLQK